LAKGIGQLSGKHNFLLSKLYFLTQTWKQYEENCNRQESLAYRPLGWILALYTKFYNGLAIGIQHNYRLEGDRYSLDFVNDSEFVKAIGYEYIVKNYLRVNYWPSVKQIITNYRNPVFSPYASMSSTAMNGIKRYDLKVTLERLVHTEQQQRIEFPVFIERLEHIGVTKLSLPDLLEENSANVLLGSTHRLVTKLLDDIWLKRQGTEKSDSEFIQSKLMA